jgi:SpoVK/Ycf46/Vps4 family AAA+-type ATPase
MYNTLGHAFDSHVQMDAMKWQEENGGPKAKMQGIPKILATYSLSDGLVFAHSKSRKLFEDFFREGYKEEFAAFEKAGAMGSDSLLTTVWSAYTENQKGLRPMRLEEVVALMNLWFRNSKEIRRANTIAAAKKVMGRNEVAFSIAFFQADILFRSIEANTMPIAYLRSWAQDSLIAPRNRIFLIARHINDLDASLRSGDAGIRSILVKRPNLSQRKTYLTNYDKNLKTRADAGNPYKSGDKIYDSLNLAPGFEFQDFANLSAGLSRKQLETIFLTATTSGTDITDDLVRTLKSKVLKEEHGEFLDIIEPTYGFEAIGGHEGIKKYLQRKVIDKLRKGDITGCARGVLLVGPPGTAKTRIAIACAYESKLNVININFGSLFGGIVGESEKNIQRCFEAIDAASPCIVIGDEIDTQLSGGRQSQGDSGVSSRMLGSVLKWMSDPSHTGKIVFCGISNRPDLLDSALIRAGRIDAILPALPPAIGDIAGRTEILLALAKSQKVKFAAELKGTMSTPDTGLGRLLCSDRLWTGAEIEVLIHEARDNAEENGRKEIALADWDDAFNSYIPNTRNVELMTKLALCFTNNIKYLPELWKAEMKQGKESIRKSLETNYGMIVDSDIRE